MFIVSRENNTDSNTMSLVCKNINGHRQFMVFNSKFCVFQKYIVLNVTSIPRLNLQYYGAAYLRSLQFSLWMYHRVWHTHSNNISIFVWYVLVISYFDMHTFTHLLQTERWYDITWNKCNSKEIHSSKTDYIINLKAVINTWIKTSVTGFHFVVLDQKRNLLLDRRHSCA
jgi:hypothetical protein